MFDKFDINKDGHIDREEFKKGLNEKLKASKRNKRDTDIVDTDVI
jgi:hypothetical protein